MYWLLGLVGFLFGCGLCLGLRVGCCFDLVAVCYFGGGVLLFAVAGFV